MSRPLNDPTVEEAQKEIHRRLLREEKLKRIEAEEMRRLSAMGWKPRRGGPAAHRGTSVHDAADAIEETERRRRAYAQEVQRRAEARQSDPKAMRDEWEVRRRAQDRRDLNEKLDELEAEWRSASDAAAKNKYKHTAEMLKHYLGRSGRTGRAAEFRVKTQWPQQVTGVIDIGSDGKPRLQSIEWADVDPWQNQPWP